MINDHLVLVNTLLLAARAVVALAAVAVLDIDVNVNLRILLFVALPTDALGQLHELLDVLLNGC